MFYGLFSMGGEGGVKLILSDCKLTSIPALYNFLFSCQIIHASNLTLNVYINQYLQHKRHVYRLSQINQQDTWENFLVLANVDKYPVVEAKWYVLSTSVFHSTYKPFASTHQYVNEICFWYLHFKHFLTSELVLKLYTGH